MKYNRKKVQLFLIAIGLLLIFSTYFLYPKINQYNLTKKDTAQEERQIAKTTDDDLKKLSDKDFKKKYDKTKKQVEKEKQIAIKKQVEEERQIAKTEDGLKNVFHNVEYKGLYDYDKPFVVSSEKARVLNDYSDIVYMTNMKVTMYMKDGRIVIITSDQGKYDKLNHNCFFEYNVKATDGETIILAENLDLLATNETASIYNDVILTSERGSLWADQVDYDFNNEMYQVSMFINKGKVKIKLVK